MKVAVTGANGFVGREVCAALGAGGIDVVAVTRRECKIDGVSKNIVVSDIGPDTDWSQVLDGCDAVVHLAARVHMMRDTSNDPLQAYRTVNTAGTLRLGEAAANAGVKQFVFLSSIKVNGERTLGTPFSEDSLPAPVDVYGISKWEAEQGLAKIDGRSDMRVIILRAPLVYGPGVGGNFLSLLKLCALSLPLPLGGIDNQRSLLFVENLADAVRTAVTADAPKAGTYLLCDGHDISTSDLIRRIAKAMGRSALLFPVPKWCLLIGGAALGKGAAVDRLCGSLQVDGTRISKDLGWQPPATLEAGLEKTVGWFLSRK